MKEPIILVDIDGTLADNQHRQRYLNTEKADWSAFFDAMIADKPIMPIVKLVQELWIGGYKVILVTGRPESHRMDTYNWLVKHQIDHDELLMRQTGDLRADVDVKRELIAHIKLEDVEFALEDHSRMAAMYRELGITCLVVGEDRY